MKSKNFNLAKVLFDVSILILLLIVGLVVGIIAHFVKVEKFNQKVYDFL